MHPYSIPQELIERVRARAGKEHPFDVIDPIRTALVVVDMQNYFVKEGFMGEVPKARDVVPSINKLSRSIRDAGGKVYWVKNTAVNTLDEWSVFNNCLMTPDKRDLRYSEQHIDHEGHKIYSALNVESDDTHIVKRRFSAFIQGSSDIVERLNSDGIDTILIAGTATNVCCESSARDAMMLNFKTIMVADALATWTDEEHAAALTNFYSIFGDVQTVDEVIGFMVPKPAVAVPA